MYINFRYYDNGEKNQRYLNENAGILFATSKSSFKEIQLLRSYFGLEFLGANMQHKNAVLR